MDVPNRWNSTFLLLESALPLREAFRRFAMIDSSFIYNPSEEEWRSASIIVECLRPFYLSTLRLSGTKYTTANLLLAKICEIRLKLVEWERSDHAFIRVMASSMLEKFLKYWDSNTLSWAIAAVLDPRCKMLIVKWYYGRIYSENSDKQEEVVENVKSHLRDLFIAYGGDINSIPSESSTTEISPFDLYCGGLHQCELDKYLEEGKEAYSSKTDFDILDWWSLNKRRFPVLSNMSRDILGTPASTVASEAVFSIGGRIISESRSCLKPDIIELLIVAGDLIPDDESENLSIYKEFEEECMNGEDDGDDDDGNDGDGDDGDGDDDDDDEEDENVGSTS